MHQKQPPANVAVATDGAGLVCAASGSVDNMSAAIAMNLVFMSLSLCRMPDPGCMALFSFVLHVTPRISAWASEKDLPGTNDFPARVRVLL
jgi:hypothetical protein